MPCEPCGCDLEAQHTCEWHRAYNTPSTTSPPVRGYVKHLQVLKNVVPPPLPIADIDQPVVDVVALDRKQYPVATGLLDYFPKAIMEVAHVSYVGNEQHHPGTPVHWDRTKSIDEADAMIRHFLQRGQLDTDGVRHTAKMVWRALAYLEKELEQEAK